MEKAAEIFEGVFADKRLDERCKQVYGAMVDKKSCCFASVHI